VLLSNPNLWRSEDGEVEISDLKGLQTRFSRVEPNLERAGARPKIGRRPLQSEQPKLDIHGNTCREREMIRMEKIYLIEE